MALRALYLLVGSMMFMVPGQAAPPVQIAVDSTASAGLLVRSKAVDGLMARAHDSRVDLEWSGNGDSEAVYSVFRSLSDEGAFEKIGDSFPGTAVYSDFIGTNGATFFYRVSISGNGHSDGSPEMVAVSATTKAMNDDELLTSVQEATFRYFWQYGHPVSGLARERTDHGGDQCTTGGSGFGMMAIVVGVERGFVARETAAERMLKIAAFLEEKAERYHGVWSHWLDGATGETIPFARKNGIKADNGGDLVETSFLVQGLLTARQYFDQDTPVEREIRERITRMWHEVEWDWYLREPDGKQLYWHWSPEYGWMMDHQIGGFNECLITYLLAIASPSHPIPPDCYEEGWVVKPKEYTNPDTYYGYRQWVGWPMGGRLFFTHYSFLGFDPRSWRDRYCNYFENNRNISLIHRAYCIQNPKKHEGYGEQAWGLTSCMTPDGYRSLDPLTRDNGTIAPTAALSAFPYTPEESMAALRYYYYDLGSNLWGPFGFYDAFNLDRDWFAGEYLAIDQGPIICMIENYRTGLLWDLFMSNPEIEPMLESIGWTKSETKEGKKWSSN